MKAFGIEIGGGGAPKQPLVVGGPPSVDLLPPEVRIAKRSRRTRRGIVAAAVAVIVLAGAGAVAAKAQSLVAQAELAVVEARTIELLQAQSQFAEVTNLQTEIDERTAARWVVTSQEIDWSAVVRGVGSMLPEGTAVTSIVVDGATPMTAYGQPVAPLQGPRIATVTITTIGVDPAAAPAMLDRLAELDGYVDGHVPTRSGAEGAMETSFVVHLDAEALAGRFPAPEGVQAGATAEPQDDQASAEAGEEQQ